ncbi:MAG: ankyrin repeat domain-containing protein [Amoebophilaceae bacterium]|nr:ankyrin repeat domain-containing protein [Amoebophilaceae bacterium]
MHNLHLAVKENNPYLVKTLLQSNLVAKGWIGVNQVDKKGRSPLHLAAKYGYHSILLLLLEDKNVAINQQDQYGKTPLHYAARAGHIEALMLLVGAGADLYKQDIQGALALHYAAQTDRLDIVRYLLSRMKEIDYVDNKQKNILHYALMPHMACLSEGKVAEYLLPKVERLLNKQTIDGYTPLHYATYRLPILKLLKSYAARIDANLSSATGRTPLHDAIFFNNYQAAKTLLKHFSVDVNKVDGKGNTALHDLVHAMKREQAKPNDQAYLLAIAKLLVTKKKVNVSGINKANETPLALIKKSKVKSKNLQALASLLIKHGAK